MQFLPELTLKHALVLALAILIVLAGLVVGQPRVQHSTLSAGPTAALAHKKCPATQHSHVTRLTVPLKRYWAPYGPQFVGGGQTKWKWKSWLEGHKWSSTRREGTKIC